MIFYQKDKIKYNFFSSISVDFLEQELAMSLNFSEWNRQSYNNLRKSVNIVKGKMKMII